jgi:hypothetical protein
MLSAESRDRLTENPADVAGPADTGCDVTPSCDLTAMAYPPLFDDGWLLVLVKVTLAGK